MDHVETDEDDEAYDQERLEQMQAVQEQIRKAFSDTEYPGPNRIYDYLPSRWDFVEQSLGQQWQELSPGFVRRWFSEMTFFGPEGFRYYLPAYMIESLIAGPENMLQQTILGHLAPPPYGLHKWDDFNERVEPLFLEQKRAVLAYLEHLNEGYDNPDDQYVQALTHYWRQFA